MKSSLLSREQENKKVFLQLGKKFNIPLDIIIFLYNTLRKSIYNDRSLQINFHKNILSSHLCGPSSSLTTGQDIDDKFFNIQNPFQYRYPLGKGNEWLIHSNVKRKDNIFYHGLYNQLKPRDILHQQIKIYGETEFILKTTTIGEREYYEPLTGYERTQFIDKIGIDLFDEYFNYLDEPQWNIIKSGDSHETIWLDDQDDQ